MLVDVVDYAALLFEGLVQLLFAGMGFLELIAEIFIGLLETCLLYTSTMVQRNTK